MTFLFHFAPSRHHWSPQRPMRLQSGTGIGPMPASAEPRLAPGSDPEQAGFLFLNSARISGSWSSRYRPNSEPARDTGGGAPGSPTGSGSAGPRGRHSPSETRRTASGGRPRCRASAAPGAGSGPEPGTRTGILTLAAENLYGDCGYPSVVRLDGGEILVADYLRQGHGPFVNPPDKFAGPYAAAVKFRISDVR